jgi:hypothetical protein
MHAAGRVAPLLVTVALTAACQGTVSCGPCPPPIYVNVETEALPSGTVVTICLAASCHDLTVDPERTGDRRSGSFGLDTGLTPEEAGGREVTAEARAPDGTRYAARERMRFVDGGDGQCSCTSSSADLVPTPLNQASTPRAG